MRSGSAGFCVAKFEPSSSPSSPTARQGREMQMDEVSRPRGDVVDVAGVRMTAIPGLAADDLPGAKARKVLGLDAEGWEIGPGSSSEAADNNTSRSTPRRATARMTALLSGGGSGGNTTLAPSAADGLPPLQATSAASASASASSRRHSLLPAMLSLGSRRPSVAPSTSAANNYNSDRPFPQPTPVHVSAVEGLVSPGSLSIGEPLSVGMSSSSYFPVTPGIHQSPSLPLHLSSSATSSPRTTLETPNASSNNPTSLSSAPGTSASSAVKNLRRARGRKQHAPAPEDKVPNSISAEDAQDWERTLESAERNASWYSSIAHRPRPRPLPTGQPSKATGTPVPRAGSTSSASSTPTTDQSHQSLFQSPIGAVSRGSLGRQGAVHTSAGLEGPHTFGLGIGGVPVRRSASTSNLHTSHVDHPAPVSSLEPSTTPPPEQEEELLDEGSVSGTEGAGGMDNFMSGGLSPSAYPHLQMHGSLGSPIRSQSAAGMSSAHRNGDFVNTRSPSVGNHSGATAHYRFSPSANVVGSPDRFGQAYGGSAPGSRHHNQRYSVTSSNGTFPATGSGLQTRPRRPSNDPHPLPPFMAGPGRVVPNWDRRPSLGNEILTSAPGWGLVSDVERGAERVRSGSFGSAVTPATLFNASRDSSTSADTRYFVGQPSAPGLSNLPSELLSKVGRFAMQSGAHAAEPWTHAAGGTAASTALHASSTVAATDPVQQRGLSRDGVHPVNDGGQGRAETEHEHAQPHGGSMLHDADADDAGSTQDSERDSVLVSDTEMDGALGRAFRLYSAQQDEYEEKDSPSGPNSKRDRDALDQLSPPQRRPREDSESTQLGGGDVDSVVTSPHTPAGAARVNGTTGVGGSASSGTPRVGRTAASAAADSTSATPMRTSPRCDQYVEVSDGSVPAGESASSSHAISASEAMARLRVDEGGRTEAGDQGAASTSDSASRLGSSWRPDGLAGGESTFAEENFPVRRDENVDPEEEERAGAAYGSNSTDDIDQELYLDMHERGQPSDIPRPVSVYSDSLGSQEDDDEAESSWYGGRASEARGSEGQR
ncbi:hypothetical protein V8E36_002794 [Tilletia maclaganii]